MNPVVKYFAAERLWCIGGAIVAVVSIGVALWFFFRVRQPLQTGVAWPFLVLGLLLFIVCLSVALRSNGDAARVSSWINGDKGALATQEVPRMTGVMRNFTVIISVEVALLIAGVCCLLFIRLAPLARGVILGLLIQAGWVFIFDLFARSRGLEYFNYLKSVIQG